MWAQAGLRAARRVRLRVAAVLTCALAAACGYRSVLLHSPLGAAVVAVVPFVESPPVGSGEALASELGEALRAGGATVTTDPAAADAVLTGTLRVINRPGTTLAAVQIYNLDGTADAMWRDVRGDIVWRGQASATESYLPQGTPGVRQPSATETQRRMALVRLTERLAHQLAEALVAAQALVEPKSATKAAQGAGV